MRACAAAILLFTVAVGARAQQAPFGLLDIALGASYAQLARELDFRDIDAALAAAHARQAGKPELGARGYGCVTRDDAFADVTCVSHQEKLDGIETREIRLQFLGGRLQQFSLTAEVRHFDTVTGYLRRRYGEPQTVPAAGPDAMPSLKWQNDTARITGYRGSNLVFVNFELDSYADAVRRKREHPGGLECR